MSYAMSRAAISRSLQPSGRTSYLQIPWRGSLFHTNRTTASSRLVINECDLSPDAMLLKKYLKPFVSDNIHQMIVIALSMSCITYRDFRNQSADITQWSHVQQCISQSKHDVGTSCELYIMHFNLYLYILTI